MKPLAVEAVRARPIVVAVLLTLNIAVSSLVVVSVIAAVRTIASVIHQTEKLRDIVSIGVLGAALIPTGAIIFWGCRAITLQFYLLFKHVLDRVRSRGASKYQIDRADNP
jgi:hypothetical protein